MKSHKICFNGEIRKIISDLSSVPLLSGALALRSEKSVIHNVYEPKAGHHVPALKYSSQSHFFPFYSILSAF